MQLCPSYQIRLLTVLDGNNLRNTSLRFSIITCFKILYIVFLNFHQEKLSVPEEKFVATNCLREFNNAYQDGSLKSKDMVHFSRHKTLCSSLYINFSKLPICNISCTDAQDIV